MIDVKMKYLCDTRVHGSVVQLPLSLGIMTGDLFAVFETPDGDIVLTQRDEDEKYAGVSIFYTKDPREKK